MTSSCGSLTTTQRAQVDALQHLCTKTALLQIEDTKEAALKWLAQIPADNEEAQEILRILGIESPID